MWSSPLHNLMKQEGTRYFAKLRYSIFPRNVGVYGWSQIYRFADFAAAKGRSAIFVECLTQWQATEASIGRKLELSRIAPVWFIVTRTSLRLFESIGYSAKRLFRAEVDGKPEDALLLSPRSPIARLASPKAAP